MAKDRAKDSRRVFESPMSHVKVHSNLDEQPSGYERNRLYSIKHGRKKVDAGGQTDVERAKAFKEDAADIKEYNETQAGGRPLKIRS